MFTRSISSFLKSSTRGLSHKFPAFFTAKELSFGMAARSKMLAGCDKLADAV